MQAVFIVLTDSEQVRIVMERMVEIGVKGATVLSSSGMTGYLKDQSPFFSRIRHFAGSGVTDNQTIFTVVSELGVHKVLDIVDEVTGGLSENGVGIAFAVPVTAFRG